MSLFDRDHRTPRSTVVPTTVAQPALPALHPDLTERYLSGPGITIQSLTDPLAVVQLSRNFAAKTDITIRAYGGPDETVLSVTLAVYGGTPALIASATTALQNATSNFAAQSWATRDLNDALATLPGTNSEALPESPINRLPYKMRRLGEIHIVETVGAVDGVPSCINEVIQFPEGPDQRGALLITAAGVTDDALQALLYKPDPALALNEVAATADVPARTEPDFAQLETRIRERGIRQVPGLLCTSASLEDTQQSLPVSVFGLDEMDAARLLEALNTRLTPADVSNMAAAYSGRISLFIGRGDELGTWKLADGSTSAIRSWRVPQAEGDVKIFIGPDGIRNLDQTVNHSIRAPSQS